jgi:hypothetical protein
MELRADWHSGNALELYSGGGRFESRPGRLISWLWFSVFYLNPLGRCWIVNQATTASFHILSDSFFINLVTIQLYTF